jgi:hypothetical protein
MFAIFVMQLQMPARSDPATVFFMMMPAVLCGAVGGAPIAAWQCILVLVVRTESQPSHDIFERTLNSLSERLVAPSIVVGTLLLLHDPRIAGAAVFAMVAPLGVMAWCMLRHASLRRWLADVEAGHVRGWQIVACRPAWTALELRPVIASKETDPIREPERVLVRIEAARNPYRDADDVQPVARVTRREPSRRNRRAPWLQCSTAAGQRNNR